MRPVLAEMGGKNPAFVTASADLAVAASGVARSAFGLSGQKCSALSKVYVARAVFDDFLDALVETTRKLVVGDPRRAGRVHGPGHQRGGARPLYARLAAKPQRPASSVSGGNGSQADCSSVVLTSQPTIVTGLPADHRINRDELFLPFMSVLAVRRSRGADRRRKPQRLRPHRRRLHARQG